MGTNVKLDPEVIARITRRRITNFYTLKILKHVDILRHEGNGAIGAYLRKEGILLFHGSQLVEAARSGASPWRHQNHHE